MTIEVFQNEEISGGGKNRGMYTLRKEIEEELFREMLTPT